MKKKNKQILQGVVFWVIIIFGVLGLWSGCFSPSKPSVILHLAPNITEIEGFSLAKYPGSLMCVACTNFYGEVYVYHNSTLICQADDSTISTGEIILPIKCTNELKKYLNQEVKVKAIGRVTPFGSNTIESYDEELLKIVFD